jgi:photosynthetic reaction center cytochrome c subunit
MVRDLNNEYLGPLAEVFPQGRLGPLGDAPKVNCMTCHQGAYKPLLGQNMVDAYPSLKAAQPQPVVEETSDASDAGARDGSPAADGGVPMGTGSDAGSSAAATDASP